jgi:hypothetical protein
VLKARRVPRWNAVPLKRMHANGRDQQTLRQVARPKFPL